MNAIEEFNVHKETIRRQLQEAVRAYQHLARVDLTDITAENAAEMYQEYVAVEAIFEGVGGILDLVRDAFQKAGDSFTAQLELVGFPGSKTPTVADQISEDDAHLLRDADPERHRS